MMYARGLPLLMIALLLLGGCRKEELDEQGPSIQIIAPGNSTSLQIPDTLEITVQVSDERIVQTVWISLGDVNGVPIAPTVTVAVNSSSATIQRNIAVTDPTITSGNYSLAVRASDGVNTTSAFRSVSVQEAPLRLRAIFVASPEGTISQIDSIGDVSEFTSIPDMSLIEINSFTQHLFVAGDPFDPLQVFALHESAQSWQIQNQNAQPGPYFTSLFTDPTDGRTYVCSNDGAIRGYDGNGITLFNAQAITGHLPYAGAVVGDRFISEQKPISIGENRLASHTYNSGDLLVSYGLDADALRIFALNDQQMLLFGERNGQGLIQQWNTFQGGNSDLRIFTEGAITAVSAISNVSFIIALPNRIVRYDQPSNSATDLLFLSANDVAFDRANGSVLIASGQQILVVDPNNASIINTIEVGHQVTRVLPLFDR